MEGGSGGLAFLSLVFGTSVVIVVSIAWHDYRARTRGLDVLRVYAERGEEPPASVIHAVMGVSRGGRIDAPRKPPTRGSHLAHAAANTIFAIGLGWLAWWGTPESGGPRTPVVVAILAALFFAASVAARLVGAYYAPANDR